MSILSDEVQDLTMDCFYENGSISWGNTDDLSRPGIEIKLIDAFYACDPCKWIPQFVTAVKSLLNAQKVHVYMDNHPFASEIKQVWIEYDGRICTLYVTKKESNPDITSAQAACLMSEFVFSQSLIHRQ